MPMTSQQLTTTSLQNVRVVPVEPEVKSAKTFKLSLRGVSARTGSAKIADPSCYDAVSINQGSFDMQGLEAVKKYFTVEDAPRQKDKHLITCEKCGDMWHLDKNSNHPGNILHLLNHARGHDVKRKRA